MRQGGPRPGANVRVSPGIRSRTRPGACLLLAAAPWWLSACLGPRAFSQSPPGPSVSVERLIDEGRLDEASAALDRRIETEGSSARNLLLRGLVAYRQDRFDAALADLKQSFSLNEGDPDTSKTLGLCLVKLGREDLAETFFEIAVALAPHDPSAHYYLGLNAYTTKRFERAAASFEESVSLQPESVSGHSFLGRSYEALGKTDLAATHYELANKLNRASEAPTPEPPLLVASFLFRLSRLDEADRHLREALRYDDKSALSHYWLGLVLERQSENAQAVAALERAALLAPRDHRPHYALARIHRKTGNRQSADRAVRAFRRLRARSEIETF